MGFSTSRLSRQDAPSLTLLALAAVVAAAATFVGYETHPIVPLAALAAVGLAAVPPLITLQLAVALSPLALAAAQIGGAAVSPTEALATLAGFSWAARRVLAGQAPFISSPLTAPLFLLLLATAAGVVVTEEPAAAVKRLVLGTGLFFIVQLLVAEATAQTARRLLLLLAVSGTIVAIVAVVGAAGARPELVDFGGVAKNRATGSFDEPNLLASFLAFALPASLALAFAGPAALRPALAAGFVVILMGITLSLSRGGVVAALAATLVMLAWPPVRRAAFVVAAVILTFGALSRDPLPGSEYAQAVTKRIEAVRYAGAATGDFRAPVWRTTPKIIRDHLLLGIGTGSYPIVSQRYGLIDPNQNDAVEHAHSVVLTVAAETGLLGIIGLVLLAWRLPGLAVSACRRNLGRDRGLAFAVAAGLAAFVAQGLIDYPLWSNVIAALVAITLGLLTALARAGDAGGVSTAGARAATGSGSADAPTAHALFPRSAGRPPSERDAPR